jgi:DNA mismatch repair protein MutL
MAIQILSEVVAAQIAAGEVVERPASVVKELIENALDAGAHVIRVEVEAGGRRLIRITDDGQGIPGDEAELAFTRHATSKLRTIDDLDAIQTLGFRGEALASVASVAKVALLTRTADEPGGTLLRIEGGRIVDHRSAGTPVGTTITVEQLFYNTPARLKFLKAETTERRHIDAVVTRMAMAYPNVRFSLVQDGRLTGPAIWPMCWSRYSASRRCAPCSRLILWSRRALISHRSPSTGTHPHRSSTATRAATSPCLSTGDTFRMPHSPMPPVRHITR